jgi:hypothetical protein
MRSAKRLVPQRWAWRRERGQVLVIFALSITALFAAAGLAFDIGRFYSERRFLQNSADAAALAAGNALIRGETVSQADARARESLTANFAHSPSGVVPTLPPVTPVYEPTHEGNPDFLINGILISGSEIRVAVQNPVGYTFGRIVGLDQNTIGGQARVNTNGNLLPIAVRRFVHLAGPNPGAISPCPEDQDDFMDFFATGHTSCLGTETDAVLRMPPNAGSAFDSTNPGSDSTNHGPIVAILGSTADANDGSDFRGFIALDIRNFQAAGTQLYYNGVTGSTGSNTLKAAEANWVTVGGYPGPMFPVATTPPDPNDQVATMSGNSTGLVIDKVLNRYALGDEILIAVYPGSVMAIPDFTPTAPDTLELQTTGPMLGTRTMKVGKNQAFSGPVALSTLPDTLDGQNPMVTGALIGPQPITYTDNPVSPSLGSGTTVTLSNMTTLNAVPGIYTLWIQAQAGSPYLTTKWLPAAVKVGTIPRDFNIVSGTLIEEAVNAGDTVTFKLWVSRGTSPAFNGTNVNLSLDLPLPSGIGLRSFSPPNVAPSNGKGTLSTLTINTGTMAPGRHRIVVRATGVNGDGHKVTHLLPLAVDVATGGGTNDDYVDIVGFAVMRIAEMDANTISAYAITPVIHDMNDPQLRRGQVARLVPWN